MEAALARAAVAWRGRRGISWIMRARACFARPRPQWGLAIQYPISSWLSRLKQLMLPTTWLLSRMTRASWLGLARILSQMARKAGSVWGLVPAMALESGSSWSVKRGGEVLGDRKSVV